MTEEQQKFIDYINNKITPFVLKKSAVNKLFLLLEKYSLKLLYECAEISFAKYLEYDKNDVPTQESASLAIDKIGGMSYGRGGSIRQICNSPDYSAFINSKIWNVWISGTDAGLGCQNIF